MENGMMNGDHHNGHDRSRSPSPGLSRSNSRNSNNCKEINRTSLLRRNQSLSAKQIRFYRNGDRFFCGLKLAVSAERYKEFDALLAELSNKLELSTGAVRYVFSAEDGKMITDVNELQYGFSYVCSSCSVFKEVEGGYGTMKPSWSLAHSKKENTPASSLAHQIDGSRDFIKPKLVTVMKNGKPPQKKVTMLLNAKTAVSLEQVLDHLSSKGTLGKVDKLHTVDGKQIKELRHLFNDDTMFVALQSHEKFPDEGFDVDVQRFRPHWRYAPISDIYSYIPGLRPEPPPPEKTFTVHLDCILAASMSNLTTPRPVPVRARSVSPRPCYLRKSFTPSPKTTPRSSASFTPSCRPKTALGVPSEFSRKSLVPQVKGNGSLRPAKKRVGSNKPVPIRPKAGSDTPVAIRGRPRPPEPKAIPFQNVLSEDSDSEDGEGRHGYYIYIYNEKINKSQGLHDGKPTASVRPMMFSNEDKESDMDPLGKLDLKPMTLNLSPVDSLETVLA